MARRRSKTSPLDDFVGVVSLLPWWACLGVAVLSYFVLGALARPVPLPGVAPGQVGQVVVRAMYQTFASIGQFVVPFACLVAAVASATGRRRRSDLVAGVAQSRAPDALDGMSWREFELLVGEAFRLQGYEVTEQGGSGPDGGVDLVLRRGREKFLVQCKQWRAFKVGVQIVRELYGVMAAKGAAGGFVVTSGRFTEEAIAFASGRNVTLVDGPKLFGLIQQAKAARGQPADVQRAARAGRVEAASQPVTPTVASVPPASLASACPSCGKTMVQRVAKRGDNAGRAFWGCTGYPACRGTRPLDEPAAPMSTKNLHA